VRAEDRGAEHLPDFEIVRNENEALETETCRMSRHAVAEITGRRAAEHGEPQLHGACRRDGDDAILV